MPSNLRRYYGRGDLHFLTFSCYQRLPLLRTARARNLFVHALGEVRKRYGFRLVGYVVMPDHVHLMIDESPTITPSLVLKVLKQRVSRDLRTNDHQGLPRFWQPRFYDFNVYSREKIREKLEYMHANPVKRGLVENPAAWVWSSFLFYEKGESGLVPIDPVD